MKTLVKKHNIQTIFNIDNKLDTLPPAAKRKTLFEISRVYKVTYGRLQQELNYTLEEVIQEHRNAVKNEKNCLRRNIGHKIEFKTTDLLTNIEQNN